PSPSLRGSWRPPSRSPAPASSLRTPPPRTGSATRSPHQARASSLRTRQVRTNSTRRRRRSPHREASSGQTPESAPRRCSARCWCCSAARLSSCEGATTSPSADPFSVRPGEEGSRAYRPGAVQQNDSYEAKGELMYTKRFLTGVCATAVAAATLVAAAAPGSGRSASVVLPPGHTVEQWNKIAEDTVVGSGAFQIEGFIYMAYESTAVYDATVSLRDGYKPLLPAFRVYKKASPDAAIIEAAYRTLTHYFP